MSISASAIVKDMVPLRTAAQTYGLEMNKAGDARCPVCGAPGYTVRFYRRRYQCMACGAGGTVLDLVSELFHLSLRDSIRKLKKDFDLDLDEAGRDA